MSREAMKLALEALEQIKQETFHPAKVFAHNHAITILKQALEQPEPETVECHTCKGLGRIYMGCGSWIHCDTCNTTGKATTPPKREPPCKTGSQCTTKCMECAEPTPVAWLYIQPDNPHLNVHYDDVDVSQFPHDEWFPVYKQPKREWQGLTDEEIDEGQRQSWVDKQAFESAVWWAEAKLKEKNT